MPGIPGIMEVDSPGDREFGQFRETFRQGLDGRTAFAGIGDFDCSSGRYGRVSPVQDGRFRALNALCVIGQNVGQLSTGQAQELRIISGCDALSRGIQGISRQRHASENRGGYCTRQYWLPGRRRMRRRISRTVSVANARDGSMPASRRI